MSAVILCEFSANESFKRVILDSAVLLAAQGWGELLFVGRHRSDIDPDREFIAVRLSNLERADATLRAWRLKDAYHSKVDLRLVRLEPMRLIDYPLLLFP